MILRGRRSAAHTPRATRCRNHSNITVRAHWESGRSQLSNLPNSVKRKTPNRPLPASACLDLSPVTGRSHSGCDSIRFLKRLTPDGFISCSTPPAPALIFMDEDQGRPGPVALQFGHLDAPQDVREPSLCPPREPSPTIKLWMPQLFRVADRGGSPEIRASFPPSFRWTTPRLRREHHENVSGK